MLKRKPFRSAKYLAFVRTLPCMFCGQTPSDAHHVVGLHWGLTGMGMKPGDGLCMPLCRYHHQATHAEPALQRLQPEWLLWMLNKALREQWPEETQVALLEAREFVQDRMEVVACAQ